MLFTLALYFDRHKYCKYAKLPPLYYFSLFIIYSLIRSNIILIECLLSNISKVVIFH